ncbi:RNase adapter RapZ [Anaerosalibacter sp. Marseille-P3206]|uniref:RNase adapter RapZ n=1 Tax=Anaerosalibacter sp. Marseille-P3206 TaxID=1871005 RepID=UPI000984443B|nr:RNase adapter RapZ [Anaerosalibacter sp. Marseille-P3206]
MEFLIITGLSGAGKSQAMKAMEDINYYCMDNLPPQLLPGFAELCYESKRNIKKVAVVVDIRGGKFFDALFNSLEKLSEKGLKYRILFLDASDIVLIKRYKELRRPHPLSVNGRLIDGINKERELLEEVKSKADYIIDTSNFTIGMLKEEIRKIFVEGEESRKLTISVVSFGFKYGILLDGDLIFDVRFLPNPYYIEELKDYTGNDENVREYVLKWEQTKTFIHKLIDMLNFLIPYYIKEGKTQLVIGIGCTGGKHRSVAIANFIQEILSKEGNRVILSHRDSK